MITNKQKQKITELSKEGLSQREIADKLKVSQTTVGYWCSEELRKDKIQKQVERFRKKSKEERSKVYRRRLEYQKKYQNMRYRTDEVWREKQIKAVKRGKKG